MKQTFDFEQWINKYLNPHELEQMHKLKEAFSKQFWTDYDKKWGAMFKKVEANLALNPASKEAKALFDEWMGLLNQAYKDFPDLKTKVWDAYKIGAKANLEYFNKRVIDFIDQVSKHCH
ncbi:MAG: TipAS antibiotic-recognition domain-containing protein [Proteobacteria bacterium]|jgi:hypothetical protein|nr:TipAS antibiotic-recognition domain-containing protein [Pseudomonadota bacterium]